MSKKIKLLAVVGPTAVGKTALGIELAKQFNGEIISGDSQQVYRQLDIGTAKATPEEQAEAVHHLIDVRNIDETYSVYDFVQEASAAISDIVSRGKLPIIVGGALELAKFGKGLENKETDYDAYLIGLNDDRQVLYDRINYRVDLMVENGVLNEAKWLYDNYREVQAARAIGYKELFPYFSGEDSLENCVEKLKQNTRRFAKRQLTWFRNRMTVQFYNVSETDFKTKVAEDVDRFLNDNKV